MISSLFSYSFSWSFNYFFYNKELRKILYLACTAKSAFLPSESFTNFPSFSPEVDDSSFSVYHPCLVFSNTPSFKILDQRRQNIPVFFFFLRFHQKALRSISPFQAPLPPLLHSSSAERRVARESKDCAGRKGIYDRSIARLLFLQFHKRLFLLIELVQPLKLRHDKEQQRAAGDLLGLEKEQQTEHRFAL